MTQFRRAIRLALAVCLAAVSITCGGDNITRPEESSPALATTGTPASLKINKQPPTSALDTEVWAPTAQPVVLVKDAGGVAVEGVVVTASILTGGGTLQGALTATTRANGTAAFRDLGIAGTGTQTLLFTAGTLSKTSTTVTINALPPQATTGSWDAPVDWAIVPLHMSLLPTGKLLAWGKFEMDGTMAMPRLWDPAAGPPGSAPMIHVDTMLFCSGHAWMADGHLMVTGGHKAGDEGLDVTNIFDPVSETWASGLPKMAKGRWYPTVTTLWDGRMLTMGGRDSASKVQTKPEIWENNQWVLLTNPTLNIPYYPRNFVAPNGRVFYAGERIVSRWFNPDAVTTNGRGVWVSTQMPHVWQFNRDYGSAVMYESGKVLYAGGGGYSTWGQSPDPKAAVPTATAEIIDLNQSSPAWANTDAMNLPRRHLNATILPDGQVLVTGGTSAGGFNTLSGAVHAAEVWNPKTGHWTQLASHTIDRAYHSVSLLLPDGTVLHGASGDAAVPGSTQLYPRQTNHEIFRPPYLFKGVRPTITAVSQTTVGYGQKFTLTTAFGLQITDVRWIRLGSVTHAFNANQRANTLKFSKTSTSVTVTAPANGKLAPPGHYLVFILNRNGVPSTGRVIKVQ
ncbi:MAG TPA: galactose oxidase-like domain-containing protein [Gemmatimonadales bacterium]|nr:galactose oxidase-like domain-containing protein [Gemmatimonadales bacterium]